MPLLSSGNKGFNPALEDAALKENTVLTFETFNPNISAKPDYLPLVATARMFLLEANHITQLYLHNYFSCLKELGQIGVNLVP